MNEDFPTNGLGELPDDLPDPQDPTAVLLRTVLHREADAVEPSPAGYARIRAEIDRRAPRGSVRTRHTGRGSASLLAAAAALVVVATGGTLAVRSLTHQSPAQPASGAVTLQTVDSDVRETPASALPVYVTGRQNKRLVLFREFHRTTVQGVEAKVEEAVRIALTALRSARTTADLFAPDPSMAVRAQVTDSSIALDLSRAPQPGRLRPPRKEAEAAVQQLVWTATAAAAVAAPVQEPPVGDDHRRRRHPALFGLAPARPDPEPRSRPRPAGARVDRPLPGAGAAGRPPPGRRRRHEPRDLPGPRRAPLRRRETIRDARSCRSSEPTRRGSRWGPWPRASAASGPSPAGPFRDLARTR